MPDAHAGDPVLASYIASVTAEPDTLGVLLHGSRASGQARNDSDYDLIRIVTEEAYAGRRDRGQLHERVRLDNGAIGDVLYQTPSRIQAYVSTPDWYTATYLGAHVAFDRTGDIAITLARMRSEANRIAGEATPAAYDAYLNSFVRSMKSARLGDDLGRRLHAAESALALIRTLFGLESRWTPYHDNISRALPDIERAQGWPAGYVSMALSRLAGDADPSFQQQLEDRVQRLMTSRGVEHEWGDDLEPLKALRFDFHGEKVGPAAPTAGRSASDA